MSDVNDLASSLFGTSRAEVAGGLTSTVYGTATSDSSGGSVSVRMGADTLRADGQAGTSVLVPTTTDVRAGETVIVTVVDGHPVVTGVVGSGDRLRTDVDAAAGVADLAQQDVTKAQAEIDQFKKDAEATYSTKTETDEKTNAVKETIEATYLKKDDASTTYATKTELSKSADGIRSEVSEEYVTKDDAAKAYVGKSTFEQLASSIRSLVKGESTYTDPDGQSATSGIYSLVTQTRDSVTALFGDYTKTADLASTQAVRDAKKAGTDAQVTADAAKSAAGAAQGTANGAKSTADSLATLIREDSTGITVGKSADGKTYSTGRTRMTDSAFQVLDKAGKVITQLAADGASFLSGLVRIVAGKATLPGNETVNSIVIDAGDGVAALHGTISRLDATINGIKSSVSAGWEQDFGSGVVLVSRNTSTKKASAFAVYPDGVRVNGLSVSQDAHHSTRSANLNNEDYGVYTFTPSTVGNPTGNGYGYCITVSGGNGGTYGYWRQQVALVNTSGIYTRECINPASGSGWTSWRRMTYYDKPLTPVYRLYNQYNSQHLFVSSESEYNDLVKAGWTGEGIVFYAFK